MHCYCREILGPDLVFVHLKMNKEDKYKRLMHRHDGNTAFVQMMEVKKEVLSVKADHEVIFSPFILSPV